MTYGEEKWRLFCQLSQLLDRFDLLTLTKIVEVGSPNLELPMPAKPPEHVEPPPLAEPPPLESSSEVSP